MLVGVVLVAVLHHRQVLDGHAANLQAALGERALRVGARRKGDEAKGAALERLLVAREVDVVHGAPLRKVLPHHVVVHLLQQR